MNTAENNTVISIYMEAAIKVGGKVYDGWSTAKLNQNSITLTDDQLQSLYHLWTDNLKLYEAIFGGSTN